MVFLDQDRVKQSHAMVFAATAATIVSGAMAERTKYIGYLLYSIVVSALIYPVFGSWAWGSLYKDSGWLDRLVS